MIFVTAQSPFLGRMSEGAKVATIAARGGNGPEKGRRGAETGRRGRERERRRVQRAKRDGRSAACKSWDAQGSKFLASADARIGVDARDVQGVQ